MSLAKKGAFLVNETDSKLDQIWIEFRGPSNGLFLVEDFGALMSYIAWDYKVMDGDPPQTQFRCPKDRTPDVVQTLKSLGYELRA